jgi:hypothetical protein
MITGLPTAEQVALASVTGSLAIVITFLDLESTFSTGGSSLRRLRGSSAWWWGGFLFTNGALAVLLWRLAQGQPTLSSWNPWAYSFAIGLAYPALVRIKLATINLKDQNVPIGLDALYQSAQNYVYIKINLAVKADRTARAQQMMAANDLKSLARMMRFDIEFDSLIPVEEKVWRLNWLLEILNESTVDEEEKKQIIATALTNGAPSLRPPRPESPASRRTSYIGGRTAQRNAFGVQ